MNKEIALLVLISSLWVLIDAKKIGFKSGQLKGLFGMGPWGWFFGCLFLWILVFPIYLIKRKKLKEISKS